MKTRSVGSIKMSGVQNTTRGFRTPFSAGVARLAFFLRPLVDKFHYDKMLGPSHVKGLLKQSRENPYDFNVPYRVLMAWSYPQGILSAHHDITPIIANYYCSLFFLKSKARGSKDAMTPRVIPAYNLDTFAQLGYIDRDSRDLMAEEVDPTPVVAFLLESVLDGWYVSTNVNKYYIPGASLDRFDFRHPLLVTGCNAERSAFSAITYSGTGEYTKVEVPLERLARAIVSRAVFERMTRPDHKGSVKRLRRFRPKKDVIFSTDFDGIAAQLTDFLASRVPPEEINNPAPDVEEFNYTPSFLENCAFGMATYDCFAEYFDYVLSTPRELDFRVARALWEHKDMMQTRLRYLEQIGVVGGEGRLSAEYKQVVDWALMIRILFYTWQKSKTNTDHLLQVTKSLARMRDIERKVVQEMVGHLSSIK